MKYPLVLFNHPRSISTDYIMRHPMENSPLSTAESTDTNWYSEEFITAQVSKYLKENGYKIHKEAPASEALKTDKAIIASKYFKKEVIEVKGYPTVSHQLQVLPAKTIHAKN